jgi:type II secretory pathway pseudopilin PulG
MTKARNQDGFALIEAIVSAAVLAIVALAVLAGIDGATASTARERARAVASTLAEQDQERVRSYRFDELTELVGLRPEHKDRNREVTVDGIKYFVNTEVTLQVDSGSPTTGCGTGGAKQSEYLRVVTTVTSPIVGGTGSPTAASNGRIQPVKIESLVAPPVSGSLVVKVLDAKGIPVSGVSVIPTAKSGRVYPAQLTNPQGCALFVAIESGTYTVEITKTGYVDRLAQSPGKASTTVSPNLVNVLTMSFDRAVDLTVNVKTLRPGTTFSTSATAYDAKATAVSDNSADPNSLRTYTPAQPSSTIIAPGVYPFTSGYSFFTGKCAMQSPVKVGLTHYFSQTNPGAVVIADASKLPAQLTATVYEPALNVRVNSSSDLSGSYTVTAYLQPNGTDTCAEDSAAIPLSLKTWPSGWGAAPNNNTHNWVSQAGTDFDPGLPFGQYIICFRTSSGWRTTPYDNRQTHRSATVSVSTGVTSTSRPSECSA